MCQQWWRIVALVVVLWGGWVPQCHARTLQLEAAQVLDEATGEWAPQALPDDWAHTRLQHGGLIRYKVVFDADGLWTPLDVPVLYMRRVCSNAAVYLNGALVATGGRMELPYTRNCFVPQMFTLPMALIRPTGNTLVVQVAGYPLRQISAKLLTIAQCSQAPVEDPFGVSRLARQALDDMRLSVRGLTTEAALVSDALADWRAEAVQRLADAGMEVEWLADDPQPGQVLPSRLHVQLTRVLREAVSNVIRHSGATRCRASARLPVPHAPNPCLVLSVEDDGQGLPPGSLPGHGLCMPNMERRARKLGGTHRFECSELGGLKVKVTVPMGAAGMEGVRGMAGKSGNLDHLGEPDVGVSVMRREVP